MTKSIFKKIELNLRLHALISIIQDDSGAYILYKYLRIDYSKVKKAFFYILYMVEVHEIFQIQTSFDLQTH
jgi:hypothetical protein